MRVASASLGVFVPGLWTLPENPVGEGLGGLHEFVPGRFKLSENPIVRKGVGDFVRARFTLPPVPAGIGDLVDDRPLYPIPENSVLAGARAMGLASCRGCRCGGCGGLGDTTATSTSGGVTGTLNDLWTSISNAFSQGDMTTYLLAGSGVLILAYMLLGHQGRSRSEYQSAKTAARKKYRQELTRIREEHPTTARRIHRAVA